jgi:hypothetical protein
VTGAGAREPDRGGPPRMAHAFNLALTREASNAPTLSAEAESERTLALAHQTSELRKLVR